MTTNAGFARLQVAMASFAQEYSDPARAAKKRGEELDRPTDAAFAAIFYGFTEISNTLDALDLIETLIGLSVPRSKRIKKEEYLKFLIGTYLQEVYILEQRLTSYVKKLGRVYQVPGGFKNLAAVIQDVFCGITRTRGSHVHSQRYSNQKLDMLTYLSLISTFKPDIKDDLHFEYKLVRHEWRKTVKENNAATRTLMDFYCDRLFEHISKNDQIFLPSTGKVARRTGRLTRTIEGADLIDFELF